MKKLVILFVTVFTFGTFGATAQQAHASFFGKVAAATYIYKNRATIKEMFDKARTKAGVTGFPKFKAGASNGAATDVKVVTKHHTVDLGNYPTSVVNQVTKADHATKAEISKYI